MRVLLLPATHLFVEDPPARPSHLRGVGKIGCPRRAHHGPRFGASLFRKRNKRQWVCEVRKVILCPPVSRLNCGRFAGHVPLSARNAVSNSWHVEPTPRRADRGVGCAGAGAKEPSPNLRRTPHQHRMLSAVTRDGLPTAGCRSFFGWSHA